VTSIRVTKGFDIFKKLILTLTGQCYLFFPAPLWMVGEEEEGGRGRMVTLTH
jgi:hypothetical protein